MAIGPLDGSAYRNEQLQRPAHRPGRTASEVEQAHLANLIMMMPLIVGQAGVKDSVEQIQAVVSMHPLAQGKKRETRRYAIKTDRSGYFQIGWLTGSRYRLLLDKYDPSARSSRPWYYPGTTEPERATEITLGEEDAFDCGIWTVPISLPADQR
jgi:hypothetical protein